MAAYLRNAPPAYECNHDRGALPPLSHFRPGVPSIPASRRDIQEGEGVDVSVQTRNQPAAVYPQSIKDDCQREYQQRQLSPWLDTQPPTSGSRHFASTRCEIYPTSCTYARACYTLAQIPLAIATGTYRAIGLDFPSLFGRRRWTRYGIPKKIARTIPRLFARQSFVDFAGFVGGRSGTKR